MYLRVTFVSEAFFYIFFTTHVNTFDIFRVIFISVAFFYNIHVTLNISTVMNCICVNFVTHHWVFICVLIAVLEFVKHKKMHKLFTSHILLESLE